MIFLFRDKRELVRENERLGNKLNYSKDVIEDLRKQLTNVTQKNAEIEIINEKLEDENLTLRDNLEVVTTTLENIKELVKDNNSTIVRPIKRELGL